MIRLRHCAVLVLFSTIIIFSCSKSSVTDMQPLKRVQIIAAADANRHSPAVLDLVFVYNEILRNKLANMSAADWFAEKSGLIKRNAGLIRVASERVAPGAQLSITNFPPDHDIAIAGFVFINYISPGAHRALLPSGKSVRITMREKRFDVSRR